MTRTADHHLAQQALCPPRHDCVRCGASCSSFRIGPLPEQEVERVMRWVPRVAETYPDQVLEPVFQRLPYWGEESPFLAKRDGRCVFIRDGVGCTLHAVAGGEEKPLVCQLFPLQLLRVGDGVRVGVRPICLGDHRCWEHGTRVPETLIRRALEEGHPVQTREALPGEQEAAQLVGHQQICTEMLLCYLAGQPDLDSPPDVEPWLQQSLEALLAAVDEATRAAVNDHGPLHPRSATARSLADLRAWLGRRPDPGSWPAEPPELRPYLRDVLRRLVFLRMTSLFPSVAWALLHYVAVARWAAAYATAAGGPPDMDRFGPTLATLLILVHSPRLQRELLRQTSPFA